MAIWAPYTMQSAKVCRDERRIKLKSKSTYLDGASSKKYGCILESHRMFRTNWLLRNEMKNEMKNDK